MGKVIVDETNLARIAQAIRVKRGTEEQMFPSEMASAILSISTVRPSGTVNIQSNGIHNVTDYSQAVVNVPNSYTAEDDSKVVVGGALVSQSALSITADGNYDTTSVKSVMVSVSHMTESLIASQNGVYTASLYAYSRVVVNVSAPEPTLENISVTSNGTYEPSEGVDGFSGVVVDVPSGTDTADATLSDGAQMRSGVTAYASGSKYTGTMPDYSGSVNSGTGSIGSYGVYSGGYFIAPSTSNVVVPTRHKVFLSDLTIASYSASSAVVNLQDILIESNGTYVADAGYDGFGNVVVDIEGGGGSAVLSDGYFTSAGEYHASDVDADGWSVVTIDMPEKVLGSATFNANGVYSASDVDGWSKVTVNVSAPPLMSITLSANGTFSASSYGVAGFSKVVVSVSLSETVAIPRNLCAGDTFISSLSYSDVVKIGSSAFKGCTNLSYVSLPVCVSIGESVFYGCTSLTEAYMPMLSGINFAAFYSCENLSEVNFANANDIHNYAFCKCSALSRFENSYFSRIPQYTFAYCTGLQEVSFASVSEVYTHGFYGCTNLSSVYMPMLELFDAYWDKPAMFTGCTALRHINFPKLSYICDGEVPSGTTSMTTGVFQSCGLVDLSLSICTYVGSGAFDHCSQLSEVTLPRCGAIGLRGFGYCFSLQSISIPECKSIGYYGFIHCSALQTISLPKCEKLDDYAFGYCYSLSSIYLTGSKVVSLGSYGLRSSYNKESTYPLSVFVPTSLYSAYLSHSIWGTTFSNMLVSM